MLNQDWNIQARAHACAETQRHFVKGERVFSALYFRKGQHERIDLSAEAWAARPTDLEPISAWQSDYEPPAPAPPEALKKDDAESLLRHLMLENLPETRNARYILALMLERKKVLRPLDRRKEGTIVTLVYEHGPSGEVWLISDPELKLTDLIAVQDEVAALLTKSEVKP